MDSKIALRGVAVLAAVLFTPALARAAAEEPPHYAVALEAAPDVPFCDRPHTFRHLVGGMLFDPLLRPPASRALRASIRRSPSGGYAVRIVTRDADGSVILDQHSDYPDIACFEVIWHVALATATIIEPHPRRHQLQTSLRHSPCPAYPERPPCPVAKPEPKPPAPEVKRAAKTVAPRRPLFFAGAGLLHAAGLTPDPAPGFQLAAGLGWSRWSVEVDGRVTWPQTIAPLGTSQGASSITGAETEIDRTQGLPSQSLPAGIASSAAQVPSHGEGGSKFVKTPPLPAQLSELTVQVSGSLHAPAGSPQAQVGQVNGMACGSGTPSNGMFDASTGQSGGKSQGPS